MTEKVRLDRRNFLKQAAGAVGAVTQAESWITARARTRIARRGQENNNRAH
jgi:hypothetical protein